MKRILFFALLLLAVNSACFAEVHAKLITAPLQQKMTPDDALHRLIIGNERFVQNKRHQIDYLKKARLSAPSQHPIAIVLSCIDSRVPPEIIFDQNVGNIFVTRIAANVINPDVLAGMEYATKVAGAKLIVVLGHQSCGAIKGACENVKLGHLTQLLNKVQPAIAQTEKTMGKKDCQSPHFADLAAENNVREVVASIPKESPVIRQLAEEHKVNIVGAMYEIATGKVLFLTPSPTKKPA
jgi:carbonic anhydrase